MANIFYPESNSVSVAARNQNAGKQVKVRKVVQMEVPEIIRHSLLLWVLPGEEC